MQDSPLVVQQDLHYSLEGALPVGYSLHMVRTESGYTLRLLVGGEAAQWEISCVELAVDEARVLWVVLESYPKSCPCEIAMSAFLYGETSELSIARCHRLPRGVGGLNATWQRMRNTLMTATRKLEGLLVPDVTVLAVPAEDGHKLQPKGRSRAPRCQHGEWQ